MTSQTLASCAKSLVASGKGLLAMDESNPTCNARFAALGIPQTVETRRSWRELLITAPGLADSISGAILYDETFHQSTRNDIRFVDALIDAGIIPGIKVDIGARPLALHPGEKVTEGLDGLRERLADYAARGARFAKWRGNRTRRRSSRRRLYPRQHARARSLCGTVSGGRNGADRRARSAHGRGPFARTLPVRHCRSARRIVRAIAGPGRIAGRRHP
jgi:hypothetical protein